MANRLIEERKYGWAVCAAVTLMLFCTSGLASTGFSAYQPYLINLRGLTNTQSSTMLTVRSLFTLVGMLFTSRLIDRFSVRRVVTGSMLIDVIAFSVLAFSDGYLGTCVGAALCGVAFGMGGMIPASIFINRWFHTHVGLALGICMASTGASAMIATPIITFLVEHFSLRVSFLAEAVFILLSSAVVYHIAYSRPSCLHTVPVGEGEEMKSKSPVHAAHTAARPLMMLMMFGILVFGMPANTLHSHMSVLYSGEGFSSSQISLLVSVMGLFLAAGKCAYGWIADKIGMLRASVMLYIMVIAGSFLCTLAGNGSFAVALIAVILLSFGLAVVSVSISIYASKVSSEHDYSKTVTSFQFLNSCGGLLFGRIPGMIADAQGSYVPAYMVMTGLCCVGALVMVLVYRQIRHEDHIYVRAHRAHPVNLAHIAK